MAESFVTQRLRAGIASRLLDRWSGPVPRALAEASLVLALASLFLSAAATAEVGFTLQISYAATISAVLVGFPFVVQGWVILPASVRVMAGGLLATYALAALVGNQQALESVSRSSFRPLVYIVDLSLGLAAIGLIVGIVDTPERLTRLVLALVTTGFLGASVGIYQWLALHFGWPLADINTAPNSDGLSTGHRFQGSGLFSWERARGTFKEPLYLGTFLGTTLPVTAAVVSRAAGARRRWAFVAMVLIVLALLLTVSSLAWGVLSLCLLATACLSAVAYGRPRAAAITGAALAAAVMIAPLIFVDPSALAIVTGRSSHDLQVTAAHRTEAWTGALEVWEREPLIGTGPGQSAVRLAHRPDGGAISPDVEAQVVLGSAQGLWAASLIDVGLLGLMAWTLFLVALGAEIARKLIRWPSALAAGLLAAAATAVLAGQLAGDRLDIRVWLVLGVAAATGRAPREESNDCRQ